MKEKLVKQLIWPKMNYASTVWDPYLLGQQRKLENINKCSCKIILNNDYNTYESALVSLKWMPTHVRREYNKLILCYKITQYDCY